MPLRFESKNGNFVFPYNPQSINFNSSMLLVKHKYPFRRGAETQDMGRDSVTVEVRGIFLSKPFVPSMSPIQLIEQLWAFQESGTILKMYGSELGKPVEGREFRIENLKGEREEGTVGDIPYSFSLVEHYEPKWSQQEKKQGANTKPYTPKAQNKASKNKPTTKDMVYVVKKGDTLWDIASKYYKDPLKHKKIMSDNKVTVKDMKPGLKLTLKGVPQK
ncbi:MULTISPECIES: LysM peptidoglycan-binding domain-containing protein [Brevibacillus]|uniref:LysM peptidoglycan-binding domain-containing protein n=1 Tax=Brevibacillus TaxID=55080 RepID=UPI000E2E7176|nr:MULTISPECIES: LysM peptidoglycan-binding domain-containing protein [Brevibacillus]MED1790795.1 LysM peptidoglycan-binding domain-containing protein [Brevibacillus laterosporus]RFB33425.1 LysM peptidoglycan-binding domain-containing protein [Brevibacillus sp. VP]